MRRMRAHPVLLLLASVALLGSRPSCDGNAPTLTCEPLSIQVEPGTCTAFDNPCGDRQWHRFDGFQLCGGPSGLIIQSESRPRGRFLCASPTASEGVDIPADYYYVTPTDRGEGQMLVTIGSPAADLAVTAAAFPASIAPGGTALLLVTSVLDGTAPYSYSWSPADSLDRPTAPDPFATPTVSTLYTVTVTDSLGATGSAEVALFVGLGAFVTAEPAAIDPGEASLLEVVAGGGTPPFTYAWSPSDGLDDPTSATPLATPDVTTTYTVAVTDADGATAAGDVTVEVRLTLAPTATPSVIAPGASSQLDAGVRGGTPPYTIVWAPADSLDDANAAMPVATPATSTLYQVTAIDAAGALPVSDSVRVTVGGTGALAACFTTRVGAIPEEVVVDASCTSGEVVLEYRWWWDWTPGAPPDLVTPACCEEEHQYADGPGTKSIRLEVLDDTGATDATLVEFEVP